MTTNCQQQDSIDTLKAVIASYPDIAEVDENDNDHSIVRVFPGPQSNVRCFPSLSSPSHPGPHLLLFLLGVAVVLGLPLMAAVEAPRQAVSLRFQSVLRPLTHVPVGWLCRGAFSHCWPTIVEPRR